ncbi:hypothetical protein V8E54_008298 [Elaphomyces granulatus]
MNVPLTTVKRNRKKWIVYKKALMIIDFVPHELSHSTIHCSQTIDKNLKPFIMNRMTSAAADVAVAAVAAATAGIALTVGATHLTYSVWDKIHPVPPIKGIRKEIEEPKERLDAKQCNKDKLQTHSALLFSYPKLRGASKPQSFQPYSSSCLGRDFAGRVMDFGSDGDVFEQTAPIQHRANELFCFEPKDHQVEAIQHLLCDRNQILIVETGFIIFQAQSSHMPMINAKCKAVIPSTLRTIIKTQVTLPRNPFRGWRRGVAIVDVFFITVDMAAKVFLRAKPAEM